jgi:hypothetical protein
VTHSQVTFYYHVDTKFEGSRHGPSALGSPDRFGGQDLLQHHRNFRFSKAPWLRADDVTAYDEAPQGRLALPMTFRVRRDVGKRKAAACALIGPAPRPATPTFFRSPSQKPPGLRSFAFLEA